MDDDDWDLQAVVRGCAAAGTPTDAASAGSFPSSSPLPLHNDEKPVDFADLIDDRIDPFHGLHEIYREFCSDEQNSHGGPPAAGFAYAPASLARQETVQNMQTQERLQFKNPDFGSSSVNLSAANSQQIRHRRKKTQQMKMVREMTQEELSADSWAWRKYGQKPIKGSPYPRNYYRCSTSKGCAARKQVERSPNDSSIFVVSYTGEHTHPRPTHRSSLAGSIRSKISPAVTSKLNATTSFPNGSLSSSSPGSVSGFSPNTPLLEGEASARNDVVATVRGEDGNGGDEDDENDININPSDMMNEEEDIFRAFEDSDDHSSGGNGGSMLSPRWDPATIDAINGGGGG